ncbi:quinohemoprotein amine dehydrogenase subunit alpha [Candidatus Palauibacter sp.]|uniref:quinohemoprotein amine dehydrogenase subunit alpha n=1 Tax=Candidatus Palauibacter sp. TaxID=3101350 RepID=UPI003B02082A
MESEASKRDAAAGRARKAFGLTLPAAGLAIGVAVLIAARTVPSIPGVPATPVAPDRFPNGAAWSHATAAADEHEGYPIESELIIRRCQRCHERDDEGRMTRISYERKTPEGWQTSVRRMVALNDVSLDPDEAREVVRYLANRQGLAPEELEPGRFEVERRLIDHVYEADRDVENTCIQCHSMGRVITQRRTREEWELLMATHRGLYPLVDFQAFQSGGDGPQPVDEAIDHLSEAFPLETPEWSAWSASMRTPRLAGTWALSGFEPGKGRIFGTVEIEPADGPDEFRSIASYTYAESGDRVRRSGQSIVYTGYQWRGRSNPGGADELREVMTVDRGWQEITGRWFTGAYDEFGPDVTLTRVSGGPVVSGVYPPALRAGAEAAEVRVHGVNLPANPSAADLDFGPGVRVESVVSGDASQLTLNVSVDADAPVGGRDLFVGGASLAGALQVHDGIDRIEVSPGWGMARIGGANFPKGYQPFDAIGWDDGPDGEPDTEDDVRLGRVPASWSMEEYTATFDDDDIEFVGALGPDGVFIPAIDGPNENRTGSRNNVGDVWVVATYTGAEADAEMVARRPLRARGHLIVTVPLYLKFDPWQGVPTGRLIP